MKEMDQIGGGVGDKGPGLGHWPASMSNAFLDIVIGNYYYTNSKTKFLDRFC